MFLGLFEFTSDIILQERKRAGLEDESFPGIPVFQVPYSFSVRRLCVFSESM